jgi:hypothetical protein
MIYREKRRPGTDQMNNLIPGVLVLRASGQRAFGPLDL